MQANRHPNPRTLSFRVTAVLIACLAVVSVAPLFGQADSADTPDKSPGTAEQLANIVQKIYFPNLGRATFLRPNPNIGGSYGGDDQGGHSGGYYNIPENSNYSFSNRWEAAALNAFGDRVLFDADSKTVRDINELIFMLSHEGKLPARLQRLEAKNAALEAKLQQPITLSMHEMPFEKFLDLLSEMGISVFVDIQAFDAENCSGPLDEMVSPDVTNLPAICALELALCQDNNIV